MSLWSGIAGIFRRTVCAHEWEDAWVFANCVEVTIPRGGRRPVSWQVMKLCANCDAMERRQLTRAEYDGWIDRLEADFYADGEGYWVEDLSAPEQARAEIEGEGR